MTFKWIGWCKENQHDKVWMIVQLNSDHHSGRFVTVWGRRGKKLQSKIQEYQESREIDRLISSKEAKGYRRVEEKDLNSVYPEFQNDLEKTTVWALLTS